jgi:hypothetical protein
VNRWWALLLGRDADREIGGPRPQVIGPGAPILVAPPVRLAWDEKRWDEYTTADGKQFVGRYRVFDEGRGRWRTFDGRILVRNGSVAAYIATRRWRLVRTRTGRVFNWSSRLGSACIGRSGRAARKVIHSPLGK